MIRTTDNPQLKTLDISLPKAWHELTGRQLCQAYRAISSGLTSLDSRLALALRWAGFRPTKSRAVFRLGKEYLELTPHDLHSLADALAWFDDLPPTPSRPDKIGCASALSPLLYETDFETFLTLDNLFQGFLATKDDRMLDRMFGILYRFPYGSAWLLERFRLPLRKTFRRTVVIYWFTSLKMAFSRLFPDFLQLAPSSTRINAVNPMESVNAQLRALTKGDITKENDVRRMPCHRALTELDALARESRELDRISKSKS